MILSDKGKWNLFFALVGLLCLSLFAGFSGKSHITVVPNSPAPATASLPASADNLPAVDALRKSTPVFEKVRRNIFEFQGESVQTEQLPVSDRAVTLPKEPALPDVHYLGRYQEKGPSRVKLAAISNGGKIYLGGVGDVLAGRYQVLQIEDEFLVLRLIFEKKIVRFSLGKTGAAPVDLTQAPSTYAQTQ